MASALRAIVFLIGLGILFAGAAVVLEPEKSAMNWIAWKFKGEVPFFGRLVPEPYGGILPTIGKYVIEVHHRIGVWDVSKALLRADKIAKEAGAVTAGIGIVLMVIALLPLGKRRTG
jgi:hypothetical protein